MRTRFLCVMRFCNHGGRGHLERFSDSEHGMKKTKAGRAFREVFRLGTWDEKDQGREGI